MDAAARAHERFHAVLGSHPVPSVLVAAEGVIAVNDAASSLMGFSETSIVELGPRAFVQDFGEWWAAIRPVLSGGVPSASFEATMTVGGHDLDVAVRATGVQREGVEGTFGAILQFDPRPTGGQASGEAALRRARDRYERLVHAAQEGIWEIDADGRTTFANPRMAEILGCSVDEMLRSSLFDFLDDDMAATARRNLEARRSGTRGRFDMRYRRPDGATVWAMVSSVPLFDDRGEWSGVAATVVDVTERRRQEAELRDTEQLLRRTFEGSPIGMALVGLDGRWLRVNPALCSLVGRTTEELTALTFQDITVDADLQTDLDLLESTLAGQRSGYQMEKRYIHGDGRTIWVNLTVSLLRDDTGQPQHFLAQIEDITTRKAAELELARLRQQLERIIVNAAVAMVILDEECRMVDTNERFDTLFGTDTTGAGRFCDLLTTESADRLRAAFGAILDGGEPPPIDVVVPREPFPLHARLELAELGEPDRRLFIVQVVDITGERLERVELERLAMHDPLTGLLNRRGLDATLTDVAMAPGDVTVLYLDLDGFKAVNDTLGHEEGDRLLVQTAAALQRITRPVDIVARMGGDEFVVVLPGVDAHGAVRALDRAAGALAAGVGDRRVRASIGSASGSASRVAELVRDADVAMLARKRRRSTARAR